MSPESFVVFLIATLVVNLSPGPSIFYVSSVAAANGFRAALFSVLGMSVGISFHVLAAATGLAALIAASTTAFLIVKYVGAGYLVYLGGAFARDPPIFKNLHCLTGSNNFVALLPPRGVGGPPQSQDWYVLPRLSASVSRSRRGGWIYPVTGSWRGVHRGGRDSQRFDWISRLKGRHLHRSCCETMGRALDPWWNSRWAGPTAGVNRSLD